MSRIGNQPIKLPEGVTAVLEGKVLNVKGPKGELTQEFHGDMKIELNDGIINVERPSDAREHRELHGLTRALIANMVEGVSAGYERRMQVIGIGFSVEPHGKKLVFQLGYSHSIVFDPPEGIVFEVQRPSSQDKLEFREMAAVLTIKGIDKQLVGQTCAKIRSFRPPEPYKGKGIRFKGEYVRKKAGKQVATTV